MSLLIASVVGLGLVGALAVGTIGGGAVAAERAQATADASALAGAVAGDEAARSVAIANHATLIRDRVVPAAEQTASSGFVVPVYVVEIRRSGATATAAASAVRTTP